MLKGWMKRLWGEHSMRLLLIAIGCFALNYICWNILNAMSYVAPSESVLIVILNEVLGTAFGISFSAGLALFPVGLCLWKRSWRYPKKFFVLTGMSLIIALFMIAVIPAKSDHSMLRDMLLKRTYWSLSIILFLQMVIQSAILGVTHLFTFRRDPATPNPKWWWRLLLWFATFAIWVVSLYFSARYLDKNFCC